MCEEYNGWTNRETWAVALWLNNDGGLYDMSQDYAKSALEEHPESGAVYCLEESLENLFDEAFSDLDEMTQTGLTMMRDIGSLYRVNWREIAGNIISELKTQEEANA